MNRPSGQHAAPSCQPSSGTVRVALFAGMAETLGSRVVDLPWSGGTAAALRQRLAETYPTLAALAARSAVAIDDAYLTDQQPVPQGAHVAIIPPVSGG